VLGAINFFETVYYNNAGLDSIGASWKPTIIALSEFEFFQRFVGFSPNQRRFAKTINTAIASSYALA